MRPRCPTEHTRRHLDALAELIVEHEDRMDDIYRAFLAIDGAAVEDAAAALAAIDAANQAHALIAVAYHAARIGSATWTVRW